MKGSLLKRLASVGTASDLDIAPGNVTLQPTFDGMIAWYRGSYSACGIETHEAKIESPVSLEAREFQQLTSLFDDASEVQLTIGKSALTIQAGSRRVSLRYKGDPDIAGYDAILQGEPAVEFDAASFVREVDAAADRAAESVSTPVLTGVRIVSANPQPGVPPSVRITAANGTSLVFESTILAKVTSVLKVIAPKNEISVAAKLIRSDTIEVGSDGKTMTIRGGDCAIRIPLLGGTWPQLDAIRKLNFDSEVDIPSSVIKALVNAVKIYRATEEIVMRPAEGGIVLETKESELGQFQETIEGTITKQYTFAANDLEAAAKISEGRLKLSFAPNSWALAKAESRQLYILVR